MCHRIEPLICLRWYNVGGWRQKLYYEVAVRSWMHEERKAGIPEKPALKAEAEGRR
jgi:hypothetical protein